MTNQRALELLLIERACVKRGSGMEETWVTDDGETMYARYDKVKPECDRNCATCLLVQDSVELLQMYDLVIHMMTKEVENEETTTEWRDWQRNCDPRAELVI